MNIQKMIEDGLLVRAEKLIIGGKGEVYFMQVEHDDDCPTLKTGSGFDCTCNAEGTLYRYTGTETPA